MQPYLQVAVCDDEGEEGDGCVEADVDGDAAGLAVKHHQAPRSRPEVLQDLNGQSEQQQEVGHQQVHQVDAGALLLHNHKYLSAQELLFSHFFEAQGKMSHLVCSHIATFSLTSSSCQVISYNLFWYLSSFHLHLLYWSRSPLHQITLWPSPQHQPAAVLPWLWDCGWRPTQTAGFQADWWWRWGCRGWGKVPCGRWRCTASPPQPPRCWSWRKEAS